MDSPKVKQELLTWAFPGLFLDFIFLSWLIAKIKLLDLWCFNDWKLEIKRNSKHSFMSPSFLEIAWLPTRIDLQHFWEKPSPSWDSNMAQSDRMPLLYHLRQHQPPVKLENCNSSPYNEFLWHSFARNWPINKFIKSIDKMLESGYHKLKLCLPSYQAYGLQTYLTLF